MKQYKKSLKKWCIGLQLYINRDMRKIKANISREIGVWDHRPCFGHVQCLFNLWKFKKSW